MALKAIMLRSRIDKKKKELADLRQKDAEFATREANLETAIREAVTEEEQQAVSDQIDAFEGEKADHEEAKTTLQSEIEGLEAELAEEEKEPPAAPPAERNAERTGVKMSKIRSLPVNVRAFDSLPAETRQQIVEREDVKDFLQRVRGLKGASRAIQGAGLAVPVTFVDLISENVYRYSKLLNRVRVRSVKGEARQMIAGTVPEAVWTEMCGEINELSFNFHQIMLDGYKVAGFIPVCNALLDDTADDLDLSSWIVEMLSESIGLAIDKAILYGKGPASNMPLGIVTRLAQAEKPDSYPANAPEWENLKGTNIIKVDGESLTGAAFWSKLQLAAGNTFTRYNRGDQFWAMNSKTLAELRSKLITFTANGDIVANLFNTLPIINGNVDILEFMPDGDIVGGYGDLYTWSDRASIKIESSREVQFIQDNTVFKGTARADGSPAIPGAFVAINIHNTDVTTVMGFAADTANDADLQSLAVGSETLAPSVFAPNVTSYAITEASQASDKVEATPVRARAQVEINYDGKNVRNGGTVTWKADSSAHPLTVTVRNGNAVKVYTVNVTKAAD